MQFRRFPLSDMLHKYNCCLLYTSVASRLSGLKLNVFEELFKINFVPSEKDLENAEIYGEKFAEFIK